MMGPQDGRESIRQEQYNVWSLGHDWALEERGDFLLCRGRTSIRVRIRVLDVCMYMIYAHTYIYTYMSDGISQYERDDVGGGQRSLCRGLP